jgi:hypothetical protein
MKPVLTKIFKKGEYYQTYLMKLEVMFDENKKQWLYETFIKKWENEMWKHSNCDFEKIKPYITSFINDYTSFIKSCDIVEIEE